MINNIVDFLYEWLHKRCDAVIEAKHSKHMILPEKCNTALRRKLK